MSSRDPRIIAVALEDLREETGLWSHGGKPDTRRRLSDSAQHERVCGAWVSSGLRRP